MSIDVNATIIIERPIGEVSAYAGDPSNRPTWSRRITSAAWETDPPIALGSRIAFRFRFLGRDLDATYQVTELTPCEQVAIRTAQGPVPMATTFTWRAIGPDKTHMVARNHGEPIGLWKLATPLIRTAMRRATEHDLAQLKRLLETR